jgi:hypothetical protein
MQKASAEPSRVSLFLLEIDNTDTTIAYMYGKCKVYADI